VRWGLGILRKFMRRRELREEGVRKILDDKEVGG